MIILDTNIVVSGLIARRPETPPAALLNAVIERRIALLASRALLIEYGQALAKPQVLRAAGVARIAFIPTLDRLSVVASIIATVPAALQAPDRKDQHLWDLLEAVSESILVTGERVLLESDHFPGRVLTPRAALDRLTGGR